MYVKVLTSKKQNKKKNVFIIYPQILLLFLVKNKKLTQFFFEWCNFPSVFNTNNYSLFTGSRLFFTQN